VFETPAQKVYDNSILISKAGYPNIRKANQSIPVQGGVSAVTKTEPIGSQQTDSSTSSQTFSKIKTREKKSERAIMTCVNST